MPEGDVLLRVARRLTSALDGAALTHAELRWPSLGGADLVGVRSLGTVSVGKHLLTRFDDGRTLHTHLRMDGTWRVEPTERVARTPALARRTAVRAVLGTPSWTCLGMDLGMMDLVRTRDEASVVGHLGPDVVGDDYEAHGRAAIVAGIAAQGTRPIGEILIDQRVLAGIGTIYLAESLFRHRIRPWRPANEVDDVGSLVDTARALMLASANSPRVTATGDTRAGRGTLVHGRAGRSCPRCGTAIAVAAVGTPPYDRPAFYCPDCQRK
ncbi:DNA glycosylase/AP lyase, H2TH DNA-binding [Beutenbergia cavernae DSM 12333]|uniref:DNA-(apurinic or apyrimidinic site) lyase n=1 Tax=Beutenbergia cavernae (strain ATCC BAA-8 / DSM 12333 / CCUG 43141 / JCM 11478 / NBRC 16432 / NCIMB 13614 / HKI 0122) TaxID=471853 RepID=C5BWN8_BEUC1|nr:DNA-formamidopyrimidine glycosylase family protein [Beutenbergia cavernae]ACQ80704.1 DNA glycosylase/AP lyase, H2TH DNA-binding [Beutenbergia cavernae DSM 12333]